MVHVRVAPGQVWIEEGASQYLNFDFVVRNDGVDTVDVTRVELGRRAQRPDRHRRHHRRAVKASRVGYEKPRRRGNIQLTKDRKASGAPGFNRVPRPLLSWRSCYAACRPRCAGAGNISVRGLRPILSSTVTPPV